MRRNEDKSIYSCEGIRGSTIGVIQRPSSNSSSYFQLLTEYSNQIYNSLKMQQLSEHHQNLNIIHLTTASTYYAVNSSLTALHSSSSYNANNIRYISSQAIYEGNSLRESCKLISLDSKYVLLLVNLLLWLNNNFIINININLELLITKCK